MKGIAGREMRALCTLRGPFLDATRRVSFSSSVTVLACLDFTRGGPARWPARGLVRPGSAEERQTG